MIVPEQKNQSQFYTMTHLTRQENAQIEAFTGMNMKFTEVAKLIRSHKSKIKRYFLRSKRTRRCTVCQRVKKLTERDTSRIV